MLTLRLIDEIIRYSIKRRELFNNRIEKLVFFKNPIQIGEQYIVPENSLEWSDMLRIVWNEKYVEKPRFFEEFSSTKVAQPKVVQPNKSLSDILKSYLNPEDPKTSSLLYKEITNQPSIIPILNKIGYKDISEITDNTLLFSTNNLRELRELKLNKASFIQLNLTTSPISTEISKVPKNKFKSYPVYVIIIDKQSSGLLVKDQSSDSLLFTDLPNVLENLFI